MKKRKVLIAVLLLGMAFQYSSILPANAGFSMGGDTTNSGPINVGGVTDVSGKTTNKDNGGYNVKDGGTLNVKEGGEL